MKRDIIISLAGHVFVFIGLLVPSFLPARTMPPVQMVMVTAVTPQSISRLIQKVDRVETPRPKVPQVQVEEKPLPQPEKRTRKVQTVKRASAESSEKPAQETTPKGSAKKEGLELADGTKTDQDVDIEYLATIMQIIKNNWKYPNLNDPNIKTIVFFEISRDGKLLRGIRVEIRSGNMVFDKSTFDAVLKSNPFPPLPYDFSGDKLGIHLAFSY
ncbi:MAG: cell envelope integrity protein TolA [Candidatus Latescibacterota bacterium]